MYFDIPVSVLKLKGEFASEWQQPSWNMTDFWQNLKTRIVPEAQIELQVIRVFFSKVIKAWAFSWLSKRLIPACTRHLTPCLLSSLTLLASSGLINNNTTRHTSVRESHTHKHTNTYSFSDASDSGRNTNTSRVHHFRIHNASASTRHFRHRADAKRTCARASWQFESNYVFCPFLSNTIDIAPMTEGQ